MYSKDKSNRITLRLNEEQFAFVRSSAELLGVSPSDFLRMIINVSLAGSRSACDVAEKPDFDKFLDGGLRRENEKANNND